MTVPLCETCLYLAASFALPTVWSKTQLLHRAPSFSSAVSVSTVGRQERVRRDGQIRKRCRISSVSHFVPVCDRSAAATQTRRRNVPSLSSSKRERPLAEAFLTDVLLCSAGPGSARNQSQRAENSVAFPLVLLDINTPETALMSVTPHTDEWRTKVGTKTSKTQSHPAEPTPAYRTRN